MLFNSLDFAVFLPTVFFLYWFVAKGRLKLQNLLMTIASYVFYAWWDWRFLSLILFSTLVDYSAGLGLKRQENRRKRKCILWTSIVINLGILGFFKYYNFFLASFINAFSFFGAQIPGRSLNIILPVGISFYTFQTLSYTIDVYNRKLEPAEDFISFAAFVSFFPQLVAGPIERATNLLPQFRSERHFDYSRATDGLRQMLWGLVKKVLIADSCAKYADMIFNNSGDYPGSALALGAFFFAIQIYGDFSGYSDIAIGTARLFGFNLMKNFDFPYFSRDIAEFWRRWHISLTTWFRDYLYIPLGGSRGGKWMKVRNTFIIFVASGFWHGANWKFVIWGALNAVFFLPLLLADRNRKNLGAVSPGRCLPPAKTMFEMLFTFGLVTLTWVFFRADNLAHAVAYLSGIFSSSFFTIPHFKAPGELRLVIIFVTALALIEWSGREHQYAIEKIGAGVPKVFRWAFYSFLIFLMGMYAQTDETPFLYFRF